MALYSTGLKLQYITSHGNVQSDGIFGPAYHVLVAESCDIKAANQSLEPRTTTRFQILDWMSIQIFKKILKVACKRVIFIYGGTKLI